MRHPEASRFHQRRERRLSPLPLAQLCRSLRPAPQQTLSASDIPGCCADAPRCTPSSTPRSSAARRTSFETSSPSNTHPATVRENSPRARSASASPAECAPTRSAAPRTTPENAGSSAPARYRSESLAAVRAPPRSHPTRASLSGWQNSYPLPTPNTPACTHPPRSAPESFVRTPPHRAESPTPTPDWPKSSPAAAFPRARNASASSAESSVPPLDTPDAPACGSHALPSGPTTPAVADTRSAASPAPTPPTASATAHRCACL